MNRENIINQIIFVASRYKTCFPGLTSKTFEEPHTIQHFLELLLATLKERKLFEIKSGILEAIIVLQTQENFDAKSVDLITKVVLGELNKPGCEPSSQKDEEQLNFIRKSFQLLLLLGEVKQVQYSSISYTSLTYAGSLFSHNS